MHPLIESVVAGYPVKPALLRYLREAAPEWLKQAAKKGHSVEGPSGQLINGYEWRWTWGVRFSAREGGDVEAKVSDWNNAETCTFCGRKVVYIFWVYDPKTKEELPYGADHIHIPLGYPKALSTAEIKKIIAKVPSPEAAEGTINKTLQVAVTKVMQRKRPLEFGLYRDNMYGRRDLSALIDPEHRYFIPFRNPGEKQMMQAALGRLRELGWRDVTPEMLRPAARVYYTKLYLENLAGDTIAQADKLYDEKNKKGSAIFILPQQEKAYLVRKDFKKVVRIDRGLGLNDYMLRDSDGLGDFLRPAVIVQLHPDWVYATPESLAKVGI